VVFLQQATATATGIVYSKVLATYPYVVKGVLVGHPSHLQSQGWGNSPGNNAMS